MELAIKFREEEINLLVEKKDEQLKNYKRMIEELKSESDKIEEEKEELKQENLKLKQELNELNSIKIFYQNGLNLLLENLLALKTFNPVEIEKSLKTSSEEKKFQFFNTSQNNIKNIHPIPEDIRKAISLSEELIDLSLLKTPNLDTLINLFKHCSYKKIYVLNQEKNCLSSLQGHTDATWVLEKIDEKTLASGSCDKTIKIWNIESGTCVSTLNGHTDKVYALLYWGKGILISGSNDKTIKIWDINSKKCLYTLNEHVGGISYLSKIDNKFFVSQGMDKKIIIWNMGERKVFQTIPNGSDYITAIVVHPNQYLITQDIEKKILLWDIKQNKLIKRIDTKPVYMRAFALMPNGFIVSGSNDFMVEIWNPINGECIKKLSGHTNYVNAVSVINDRLIASASGDKTIKIWDWQEGQCVHTYVGHKNWIQALFRFNYGELFSGGEGDHSIKYWKVLKPLHPNFRSIIKHFLLVTERKENSKIILEFGFKLNTTINNQDKINILENLELLMKSCSEGIFDFRLYPINEKKLILSLELNSTTLVEKLLLLIKTISDFNLEIKPLLQEKSL